MFGGRSAEHDVSRMTAVAVARALDPVRYEVIPVAITTEGRWLYAADAAGWLGEGPQALPERFEVSGEPVLPPLPSGNSRVELSSGKGFDVDVVVPLLHGPYGEDGTVQGLLELADLPYVGSGVLGSAVGMDKVMMKRALLACGLPIARFIEMREGHDVEEFCVRVHSELGFPCFVKPANMGSSVGVSKAHDLTQVREAVELALVYDEWIVVEEAITGREIEVAVLGDAPPETSLPGEVVPAGEFYDYLDKYEKGAAELLVPAPLARHRVAEVRELAVRAFHACRCEAMARVDFFFDDGEGGRGFVVNELNTIPGFTPISMYPRLWEVSGLSYPELLDRLIELALIRHHRRSRRAGRQRF